MIVSEDAFLLTAPRFVALPKGNADISISAIGPRKFELTAASPVFLQRFAFDLEDFDYKASDNYFDLYPNETKQVHVALDCDASAETLRRSLKSLSLVDTY